jgi:hypothetical protein
MASDMMTIFWKKVTDAGIKALVLEYGRYRHHSWDKRSVTLCAVQDEDSLVCAVYDKIVPALMHTSRKGRT